MARGWRRGAVLAIVAAMAAGCASDPADVGTGSTSSGARRAISDDLRLIEAAGDGNLDEVRALLAKGASVAAADDRNRTALVAAAYEAHLDEARVLVEAGADVNTKDDTEQSAYLIATSEIGEADGLALLELTLAHGADLAALDSYRGTGLIRAADRGFVAIVDRLLAAGVDVDHVNRLGWTALLEAIILGRGDAAHTEVVRRLVAGGADVNLADGQGTTALAHARQRGYDQMVSILVAAGASP